MWSSFYIWWSLSIKIYSILSPRCSPLRFQQTADSVHHTETQQFTNRYEPPTNRRAAEPPRPRLTDSDVDSDEEIRRMVAAQNNSHVTLQQEEEEDKLEVVGLDYLVKSGRKGNRRVLNMNSTFFWGLEFVSLAFLL